MRELMLVGLFLTGYALGAVESPTMALAASSVQQATTPLIIRIGGVEKAASVADAMVLALGREETLLTNSKVKEFLIGGKISLLRFELTAALCELSGGSEKYTGTPVPQLIKEYGITEKEWNAGIGLLEKVMVDQKVGEAERKELTGRVETLWKTIAEQEARTYRSKEKGFSLLLPAGWEKQENVQGVALIVASPKKDEKDPFRENISVNVEGLPIEMTASEYTKAMVLGATKQLKEFKVIESVRAEIGGETAEVLIYSHKSGPVPMAVTSYFFVKGRRAVTVNCAAAEDQFQAYRAVFAESMRTFKLD